MDILSTLFFKVLALTPETFKEKDPDRDHFILSKGHCTDGYFTILSLAGFLPWEELSTYDAFGSRLSGHPTVKVDGVEMNTGALGHGLPVSVGLAKAAKMDGRKSRVFTLLRGRRARRGGPIGRPPCPPPTFTLTTSPPSSTETAFRSGAVRKR